MKTLIALMLLFTSLSCAAQRAEDSTGTATTAVVVASDSVIDDTADYTVTTTIPQGLINKLNSFASITSPDSIDKVFSAIDNVWPFGIMGAVLGMLGAGFMVFIIVILLIPLILCILLIWYILRQRRKAREKDFKTQAPAGNSGEGGETSDPAPARTAQAGYSHRLDNAIRNMCIGAGITVFTLIINLYIGVAAGIVIFCIGLSDWLVCRNHRNGQNEN